MNRERSRSFEKQNQSSNGKLHIGNLNFNVQEQEVKDEFQRLFGPVLGVKIIRKNLSGVQFKEFNYGFVHMQYAQHADQALKNFSLQSSKNWTISTSNEKNKHKQNYNIQISESEIFNHLLIPSQDKRILNQLLNNEILVRELFVGNMTQNCIEKDLQNNLGIYGEIENIDYFNKIPPFAFVKYKKVQSAIKAFDNQKTLTLLLNCPNLKIMFSDHEKRPGIVGDYYGSEYDDELSNFIYIGYHATVALPQEKTILEEIERYADVKDIHLKQAQNIQNGQRSFILIELASTEQVKKVFRKYMKEDRTADRRMRLGDKRCDIQMVLKPDQSKIRQMPNQNNLIQTLQINQTNKNQQINNQQINNQQWPVIQNYNQNTPINIQQNLNDRNPMALQNSLINPSLNIPIQNNNPYMNNHNYIENVPQNMIYQKIGNNIQSPNMLQNDKQYIDRQNNEFYQTNNNLPNKNIKTKIQNDNIPQNSILDTIFDMVKQSPVKNDEKLFQNQEDETKNAFWSGFFTRSKQHRVGIDAIILEGTEPQFSDYNLNISHRINFDEILKKNAQCIAIFQPSNETQKQSFQGYIDYFKEKKRAGIINIKNIVLYIVPKCEEFKDFQLLNDDQILGIFYDQKDNMNRINIKQYIQKNFDIQDDTSLDQKYENLDINLLNDVFPLLENPDIMKIINQVN